MKLKKSLYTLPFDQFSRQYEVAKMIDSMRGSKAKTFTILDVGGHKGQTTAFQYQDKVTILDVFDEVYENYVRGDATNMSFADNSFDFVTSFDVLEHIPREVRTAFVNEALRVSKRGVFIAAPADGADGAVTATETALNSYYQTLHGQEHRWLKEHIDYKIPTVDEMNELLQSDTRYVVSMPNNILSDWQVMQSLIFASSKNSDLADLTSAATKRYNSVDHTVPVGQIGYRRIYFVTYDKKMHDTVSALIKNTQKKQDSSPLISQDLVTVIMDEASRVTSEHKKLQAVVSEQQLVHDQHVRSLEATVRQLESDIHAIYTSSSWKVTNPLRSVRSAVKKVTDKSKK